MTRLLGCDVSHWQGVLDWDGLKAAGVARGFAKATQGIGFIDVQYDRNIAEMRRLSIIPGATHWLEPDNAAAQGRHFMDVVGDPTGLALALDVEQAGVSEADVRGWLRTVRQAGRRRVFVYTRQGFWNWIGGPKLSLPHHPLWDAGYGSNPAIPIEAVDLEAVDFDVTDYGSWTVATIRQFGSRALFHGKHIDVDCFNGTRADFLRLVAA